MHPVDKIWQWLDGKKRHLAHAYWLIMVPSLLVLWPDGAPVAVAKGFAILGIIFSAIGYGHAAIKAQQPTVNREP